MTAAHCKTNHAQPRSPLSLRDITPALTETSQDYRRQRSIKALLLLLQIRLSSYWVDPIFPPLFKNLSLAKRAQKKPIRRPKSLHEQLHIVMECSLQ